MVKVNIISGFLGAGKTTLIKKLLTGSVAKEKIILLENEYGEVGVDGSFMKDSGIIVDELNSGCICCTLVGDFQKAVDDLIAKYHPDRLLIEPSGVGKLSEILAAVERAKERHSDLVVTGCATVVDAGKCRMYMKNFGEFFLDQIKTSATVIFSRTQLLSAERIEKSRALVEEQHPGVRIVTTPWDDLSADTLLEVIESGKPMEIHLDDDDDDDDEDEHEHHHHHHDHDDHDHEDGVCPCCGGHHDDDDDDDHDHEHHHHHDHDDDCDCGCHDHDHEHHHHDHDDDCGCHDHDHEHHHHDHDDECGCGCHDHHHDHEGHHHADDVFTSWGLENVGVMKKEDLQKILDDLAYGDKYGEVLRAKGMVPSEEKGVWLHFDMVPEQAEIREGAPDFTGKVCVIGAELDEEGLKAAFNA